MPKYMMIIMQKPNFFQRLSPEELQRKVQAYQGWTDQLRRSDRLVSNAKLGDEGGKILSKEGGRTAVLDGPFAEAKEVVAGYIMFRAASYDEALELVRASPFLNDATLMLRETDPMGCGGEH